MQIFIFVILFELIYEYHDLQDIDSIYSNLYLFVNLMELLFFNILKYSLKLIEI